MRRWIPGALFLAVLCWGLSAGWAASPSPTPSLWTASDTRTLGGNLAFWMHRSENGVDVSRWDFRIHVGYFLTQGMEIRLFGDQEEVRRNKDLWRTRILGLGVYRYEPWASSIWVYLGGAGGVTTSKALLGDRIWEDHGFSGEGALGVVWQQGPVGLDLGVRWVLVDERLDRQWVDLYLGVIWFQP